MSCSVNGNPLLVGSHDKRPLRLLNSRRSLLQLCDLDLFRIPVCLVSWQVPNLELGHIEIDGEDAEPSTAGVVVERLGLTWDQWAQRVTRYLTVMERLLWPNLIIVGGGVSEAADQVSLHANSSGADAELMLYARAVS